MASPATRGEDRRAVELHASDGRALDERLTGTVERNRFTASSEGGGRPKVSLPATPRRALVKLPGSESSRYGPPGPRPRRAL